MESKETTQQTKKQHTRTHTPVDGYKIEELRLQDLDSLVAIAEEVGVQNPREFRRQELVFEILKARDRSNTATPASTKAGAISWLTLWSVAKNTASAISR